MSPPVDQPADCGRQCRSLLRLSLVEDDGPQTGHSPGESRLPATAATDKVEEQALAIRCKGPQAIESILRRLEPALGRWNNNYRKYSEVAAKEHRKRGFDERSDFVVKS